VDANTNIANVELLIGQGYWYNRRVTNALTWTEARPYADLFPANTNPPIVNAMSINAQGDEVTLEIEVTGESGEPIHHGNSSPLNSLWFQWRASRSGDLALSTDGSNFDTVLAVYTGSGLNSLSPVASDDDSGEGLRSGLGFRKCVHQRKVHQRKTRVQDCHSTCRESSGCRHKVATVQDRHRSVLPLAGC